MLENHAFTISFHFTFNMLCNMVPILHAISILNPKQKLSLLLGACLPHGLCYHSRQGFRGIRQLLPRKSIATVGGVPRIPIWTGRKNMPLVPCGNPPCSVSYLAWWWSQAYGIKAESKLQSIIRLNSMPTPAVWKQHEAKAEYKKVKAIASFWGLHIKTEDCPEIPVMNA